MKRKLAILAIGLAAVASLTVAYTAGWLNGQTGQGTALVKQAQAAGGAKASPVKALKERDVYYPGSEDLAPDEMRVTACGTGMPNARPKQAAACWLVELGNGDKFLYPLQLPQQGLHRPPSFGSLR
jgi:ribonuclease Z